MKGFAQRTSTGECCRSPGCDGPPHPALSPSEGTAIELRRNGFFPILIVILLLISKNLSRARLRLGLRLRASQCGPAAGLNSMVVPSEGERGPGGRVRGPRVSQLHLICWLTRF